MYASFLIVIVVFNFAIITHVSPLYAQITIETEEGEMLDSVIESATGKNDSSKMEMETEKEVVRFEEAYGNKSKWNAVLRSFIVPGMGDIYINDKKSGYFWLFTESAFWIGFVSTWLYAHHIDNTSRTFAYWNANCSKAYELSDKNLNLLSDYPYSHSPTKKGGFHETVEVPERRTEQIDFSWVWVDSLSRVSFGEFRKDWHQAKVWKNYCVGALVIARISSSLNILRKMRKGKVHIDFKKSALAPHLEINNSINKFVFVCKIGF